MKNALKLLLLFVLPSLQGALSFAAVQRQDWVPGQLILSVKPPLMGAQSSRLESIHQSNGLISVTPLSRRLKVQNFIAAQGATEQFLLLQFPADTDLLKVAEQYRTDPSILFAEPNYIYRAIMTPNDARYSEQWSLKQVRAPQAWDVATGNSNVVVAVIDSGVDVEHPDLSHRLWRNSREMAGNGRDDDNNGYIDDALGMDFVTPMTPVPIDENGHGTHVAGIVGASSHNTEGIAALNWGTQIMAVRALDKSGAGAASDLSEAIEYAADNGAAVINCSWGSLQSSTLIQNSIRYAAAKGVIVVGAAGNDGFEWRIYPAAYDEVFAVASVDQADNKSFFSNYGSWVDASAPGSQILSTMPTYDVELTRSPYFFSKKYATLSGTSMAAPMVSSLAALVKSRFPDLTSEQVRRRIQDSAKNITANSIYAGKLGSGRVDALNALVLNDAEYRAVSGYVKDPNGMPLRQAVVRLSGAQTGETFPDESGRWEFFLAAGKSYLVSVELLPTAAFSRESHFFVPVSQLITSSGPAADFNLVRAYPNGSFVFSAPSYSHDENRPVAEITVQRKDGSEGTATVSYGVGTAPEENILVFEEGVLSKTFFVNVVDDPFPEFVETVKLFLKNPTNGSRLGKLAESVLRIKSDDRVRLTVVNGAGSGDYLPGDVVSIVADPAMPGQIFHKWEGSDVAEEGAGHTELVMALERATVSAVYRSISEASPWGINKLGGFINSTDGAMDITFNSAAQQDATVIILTMQGQRVRALFNGTLQPGTNTIRWDGRNDSGQAVVSDIYLVQLSMVGHTETTKVVVMK